MSSLTRQLRAQDKALQAQADQMLEYVTRNDLELWQVGGGRVGGGFTSMCGWGGVRM